MYFILRLLANVANNNDNDNIPPRARGGSTKELCAYIHPPEKGGVEDFGSSEIGGGWPCIQDTLSSRALG